MKTSETVLKEEASEESGKGGRPSSNICFRAVCRRW